MEKIVSIAFFCFIGWALLQAVVWIVEVLISLLPFLALAAILGIAARCIWLARERRRPVAGIVLEEVRTIEPEPVIWVDPALELTAGPSCLVCRSGLEGYVIYCRRCSTPHHRDCFRYVGECSIYGCGSRRYVRLAA